MTEADEIADNIIKGRGGRRPTCWSTAVILTTAYMGPPGENVSRQMHDNIAQSLLEGHDGSIFS